MKVRLGNLRLGILAVAGSLAIAGTTRAESVTVNLGTSSQLFEQIGIGDDGYGNAQWYIIQGACAAGGGDTTCTLSGNYTGSTAGYTSGTYSLVTTYVGNGPTYNAAGDPFPNGPSPLIGISNPPGSGDFGFEYLPATATITLDLNESGGPNYVIPIFAGDAFVNGYSVFYSGAAPCTGVATCNTYNVGETPGATIAGTVDGAGYFDTSTVITVPPGVPEPSSITLLAAGLIGLLGVSLRKLA